MSACVGLTIDTGQFCCTEITQWNCYKENQSVLATVVLATKSPCRGWWPLIRGNLSVRHFLGDQRGYGTALQSPHHLAFTSC